MHNSKSVIINYLRILSKIIQNFKFSDNSSNRYLFKLRGTNETQRFLLVSESDYKMDINIEETF